MPPGVTPAPNRKPAPVLPLPPPAPPAPPVLGSQSSATSARFERIDTAPSDLTDDNHIAAWPVWLASCEGLAKRAAKIDAGWIKVCAAAKLINPKDAVAIGAYWNAHFDLWRVQPLDELGAPTLGKMTGYYEPELKGSRQRTRLFDVPLAATPTDLVRVELADVAPELAGKRVRGRLIYQDKQRRLVPYWSREELTSSQRLRGFLDRHALVWVANPLDAFLLQVQGSGRIRLVHGPDNGRVIRLGYADANGHPYRSIGRWLVEQGQLLPSEVSMQSIKAWAEAHPQRVDEMLNHNPSYIFFRELPLGDQHEGPLGAFNLPLSAGLSIAVDPSYTPLGTPVVMSGTHPETNAPLTRLVFAHDTGSDIKGPARIDLFWGSGRQAGELAGRSNAPVSIMMLLPKGLTPAGASARARE